MKKFFSILVVAALIVTTFVLATGSCSRLSEPEIEQLLEELESKGAHQRAAADQKLARLAPGWERFRQIAGDYSEPQRLFAQMQVANNKLLRASQNDPQYAAKLFAEQCEAYKRKMFRKNPFKLQLWPGPAILKIPLAELLAFVFVAGNPSVPIPADTTSACLLILRQNSVTMNLRLISREDQKLLWELVSLWLVRPLAGTDEDRVRLNFASGYGLFSAASTLGTRILLQARKESWPTDDVDLVLGELSRCNRPEQFNYPGALIAALEPFLDDQRVVIRSDPPVEIRDRVLALLISITNQDLQTYGPEPVAAQGLIPWLNSPGDREVALAKWKAWVKGHPPVIEAKVDGNTSCGPMLPSKAKLVARTKTHFVSEATKKFSNALKDFGESWVFIY